MGGFQESAMNTPITTTAPSFPPVTFSITDAGIAELEAKKAAKAKAEAEAKLAAEIEAAKPERERLIGHVRGVLEAIPETTTTIGNHMRADLVEALEGLLAGWKAA
jgi:hypothetical protein